MRLAELRGPRDFHVIDVPVPVPARDEVLVRVEACGVCASELDQWTGTAGISYPARIGHEVSGTVVAVGDEVTALAVGDAVAVWTTEAGFAEFVAVRADYCRARPAELPATVALVEPLACAANAVELADVRLADTVLVLGAGFMGLLVTQLAALRGPRVVIVADRRPDVLALAAQLGATRTVDLNVESLPEVVAELTGDGADVTFEVTGTQGALDEVGNLTRMSGKLVLVGYHQGAPRQIPLAQWNWMAFTLVNAHFRDVAVIMRGMTVGMQLLTSRQLDLAPLVTHRFALDDINDAFATAVDKPAGFVKAVVEAH
jgi:2-desacetyl-2-hydroxyethyl bacteriochlorophyllide A dehydrogenase